MAIFSEWLLVLTLVEALGCGLVAGIFFAFSSFVMKALGDLPAGQGMAAMQAINIAVINPLFMLIFMGTAVLSLLLLIVALLRWQEPEALYLLIGSSLYLGGSFLVTILFNVPKNDALAVLNPADPTGLDYWSGYLRGWTLWNHLRTVAALLAMLALIIALIEAKVH
ncbi:MAG TPA: anthrone oxygenase family protein [Chloroflexia bacterium]|nr:anthrone oxygenase family protein [Chloroflexia bacterium]